MCPTALYSSASALPLFSDVIVQSRTSPGLTTVALSKATSAESRSTAPDSCIVTTGRAPVKTDDRNQGPDFLHDFDRVFAGKADPIQSKSYQIEFSRGCVAHNIHHVRRGGSLMFCSSQRGSQFLGAFLVVITNDHTGHSTSSFPSACSSFLLLVWL